MTKMAYFELWHDLVKIHLAMAVKFAMVAEIQPIKVLFQNHQSAMSLEPFDEVCEIYHQKSFHFYSNDYSTNKKPIFNVIK